MSIEHECAQGKRAKSSFLALAATAIAMQASMADAAQVQPITLMWEPPTENTNGSALVDLKAYRIYSGATRGNLKARATLRNPGLATYVLRPASTAERYYAISAINSKGTESALSNVVDRSR